MAHDEAYREAERKIEEAQQLGATELDLSLMKLSELPKWLDKLAQLQALFLSENRLTTLPEELGHLTQFSFIVS